jgi:hypothetical protein
MPAKSFDKIQADADQLIRVWTANPTFTLDNVTLAVLQSMLANFKTSRSATEDLRTQLMKSIIDTNDQANAVSDVLVRGRAGIRGYFGADSSQYEQVGGVRTSQRSRPPRKAKAAAQTAAT